MKQRRALYQRLESRLREREIDAEQLWASLQLEASAMDPALAHLIEGASRRVTWALWKVAMFEAMEAFAAIEGEHVEHGSVSPWLCQSCKRRLLRVVGHDAEPETEDLAAG